MSDVTTPSRPRLLYTISEAMEMTTLSRSVIYELIRCGRLASVQQGRRRLIPADALDDYIRLLCSEARSAHGQSA